MCPHRKKLHTKKSARFIVLIHSPFTTIPSLFPCALCLSYVSYRYIENMPRIIYGCWYEIALPAFSSNIHRVYIFRNEIRFVPRCSDAAIQEYSAFVYTIYFIVVVKVQVVVKSEGLCSFVQAFSFPRALWQGEETRTNSQQPKLQKIQTWMGAGQDGMTCTISTRTFSFPGERTPPQRGPWRFEHTKQRLPANNPPTARKRSTGEGVGERRC